MTGRVAEPTWDFTCPGQEGAVWAKKWYNRRQEGGPCPPQRRTPVSSPAAAAGGTPRDPGPRGRTGGGGGGCGRTGFCGDEPSLTGTAPGRPPRSRAEQGQHGAHREGAPASDNPGLGSHSLSVTHAGFHGGRGTCVSAPRCPHPAGTRRVVRRPGRRQGGPHKASPAGSRDSRGSAFARRNLHTKSHSAGTLPSPPERAAWSPSSHGSGVPAACGPHLPWVFSRHPSMQREGEQRHQ